MSQEMNRRQMKGHLPPDSIAALSAIVKARLQVAGLTTPGLDARLIIMRATGLTHEELIAGSGTSVAPEARVQIMDLVRRREEGEPLSRIMGEREFYSRSFALNSGTLDPRPDTETLVDAALKVLRGEPGQGRRIADLGTGSGAVIITLLAELPDTAGVGTDLCASALSAAQANALRHKVANRLDLVEGSWFEALSGTFDLIVSNPPYIPSGAMAFLPREVKFHDPHRALDGGQDGLSAYRAIAEGVCRHLRIGGHLCVEIGKGQEGAVDAIMSGGGLRPAARHPPVNADLSGTPRVLTFVNA
jgi:release factor glutamine methyltransferase